MPTKSFIPDSREGAHRPSRRAVLLAAGAAPLLARCSSDPNSDTGQLTELLGQSFHVLSGDRSVTLREVQDTPFASLGVRVGSGAQTMLVLAARTGASGVWTSASHIALEIASGRILRTAGLPQNLSGTTFSGSDPLARGLETLRQPAKVARALDFEDRNTYGIAVESALAPAGLQDVDVLGTRIRCVHAVERCSAPALSWNFTNEYWAGAKSGLVWRSLQSINPDLPTVEITLFRPPK
ncbi:MAG TPA: YjbF family lipoprotein [Rhizomicrobium sp.]|jgi:hypothetical protein